MNTQNEQDSIPAFPRIIYTLAPGYLNPGRNLGPETPTPQKGHGTRDTLLPPDRIIDACENITFPCGQ